MEWGQGLTSSSTRIVQVWNALATPNWTCWPGGDIGRFGLENEWVWVGFSEKIDSAVWEEKKAKIGLWASPAFNGWDLQPNNQRGSSGHLMSRKPKEEGQSTKGPGQSLACCWGPQVWWSSSSKFFLSNLGPGRYIAYLYLYLWYFLFMLCDSNSEIIIIVMIILLTITYSGILTLSSTLA